MVKKLNEYNVLMEFIKEHSCFEINENNLFCNLCNEIKKYNPKEGIRSLKRHLTSKKHLASVELGIQQQRLKIEVINQEKISLFHLDLAEALISANITIYKIENNGFKTFLEKYTGKKINSHTFYRVKILDSLYNKRINAAKEQLKEFKFYYIIFDETTDSCGRYILNLLIGGCSEQKRQRPFLVSVIELNKTNSEIINNEIFNRFLKFFNYNLDNFKKITILLSDAAPYKIKTRKLLSQAIPKLKHVTYLCHGLHNLCETIREENWRVDKLICFNILFS